MAIKILTDTTIWCDGLDLTSQTNQTMVAESAQEKDATTFASGGYMARRGGLKDVKGEIRGFWDPTADSDFHSNLGDHDRVVTWTDGGSQSCAVWSTRQLQLNSQALGQVGELHPMAIDFAGSSGPGLAGPGVLLYPKTTFSGNSNGTGYDNTFGIPSGYIAYVSAHCFTAGTTADLIVESDDNGSFTSATTRATIQFTATGGQWTSIAATVTDNHWRVRTANVTGSFSCAVTFILEAL